MNVFPIFHDALWYENQLAEGDTSSITINILSVFLILAVIADKDQVYPSVNKG